MVDFLQQNWRFLLGAALIHVLFAGIFGLTMLNLGRDAPLPVLAIQATIVDASTLVQTPSRPKQPEPAKPPVDTAAEEAAAREKEAAAQREKEQQQEQERQAQQREQEQKQQRDREVKQQEEAERQKVADAEAKAKADADAKAKAKADAEAKAEADRKRVAEIERKQKEAAERRKAAEEERANAAREAELQRSLAEEEGRTEAVNSGLLNQYVALIEQHVVRQWNRPATARSGLECEVRVAQTPSGVVLSAQVTQCNGDAAVKQSIEAAVLRASPLPLPPDPRLFERNLRFIFRPAD
jgi:colicin import membrane protein